MVRARYFDLIFVRTFDFKTKTEQLQPFSSHCNNLDKWIFILFIKIKITRLLFFKIECAKKMYLKHLRQKQKCFSFFTALPWLSLTLVTIIYYDLCVLGFACSLETYYRYWSLSIGVLILEFLQGIVESKYLIPISVVFFYDLLRGREGTSNKLKNIKVLLQPKKPLVEPWNDTRS